MRRESVRVTGVLCVALTREPLATLRRRQLQARHTPSILRVAGIARRRVRLRDPTPFHEPAAQGFHRLQQPRSQSQRCDVSKGGEYTGGGRHGVVRRVQGPGRPRWPSLEVCVGWWRQGPRRGPPRRRMHRRRHRRRRQPQRGRPQARRRGSLALVLALGLQN